MPFNSIAAGIYGIIAIGALYGLIAINFVVCNKSGLMELFSCSFKLILSFRIHTSGYQFTPNWPTFPLF